MILGPCPCHLCHAPVWWHGKRGWLERHWQPIRGGHEERWWKHLCTARPASTWPRRRNAGSRAARRAAA